ncbi:MAG: adenosyl-hopene transferase HpnH [Acidobacteria bacterium]|nr:adenosyl-hopene transferase HpnH [Acidobacteriota bacterium]
MGVPISQMLAVAKYIVGRKISGDARYPLVLMLEPLFRCNLACSGCGKIQYPPDILRRQLSPGQCFEAAEECGAPMVSIPGGEPLLHPQIAEIVEGLIARGKFVYLCTNALILKEKLADFRPDRRFTINVHLDGLEGFHDRSVGRAGVHRIAVEAIREAVRRGFRVTTNTTLFNDADPESVRAFFDETMALGVEGMTLSPGYSYEKAADQQHFLGKEETRRLFAGVLRRRRKSWKFNQSPLFLEFLAGARDYDCTPWGMPGYSLFGWQKPCYLLEDGYCRTFAQLLESTDWEKYGPRSGNPKCRNCMVHSGFEASAVNDTFGSPSGMLRTIRAMRR